MTARCHSRLMKPEDVVWKLENCPVTEVRYLCYRELDRVQLALYRDDAEGFGGLIIDAKDFHGIVERFSGKVTFKEVDH